MGTRGWEMGAREGWHGGWARENDGRWEMGTRGGTQLQILGGEAVGLL